MGAWWGGLTALNRGFYVLAIFFSTLFGWQFIASLSGLGGESEAEAGGEAEAGVDMDQGDVQDAGGHDLVEDAAGLATFRLLSVRSIMAFGTLFSWAGALYLHEDAAQTWALVRAVLWGLTGMVVVAIFFWVLPRLAEEGTANLDTAIGRSGQVYLNIPEDGTGQIRVLVSGGLQIVRARSRGGRVLLAGTMVRVVRRLDAMTVEIEEIET